MARTGSRPVTTSVVGILALCVGLAPFLVPLQHEGAYGVPGQGLVGGLLCLAIAGVLLVRGTPSIARRAALIASPIALYLALYGALAESEEVIVLHAADAELRLWIVDDDEGGEWVSMHRSKAERHALHGARLERVRAGVRGCVVPRIVEDDTANRRTFDLRQEKYAVQRLGAAIGLFGDGPGPETITLRLDPCG